MKESEQLQPPNFFAQPYYHFVEVSALQLIFVSIGIYLLVKGVKMCYSKTKSESAIEVNLVIASFKIKSDNSGLMICFMGIVSIAMALALN